MWTGAEPAERQFNQTYIDTIKRIVGRLADRGIYTLLDMHEDVSPSRLLLFFFFGGVDCCFSASFLLAGAFIQVLSLRWCATLGDRQIHTSSPISFPSGRKLLQ
jgi:hypothetical protein